MTTEQLKVLLQGEGYEHVRQLPDGRLIGIMAQLFTTGLVVGLHLIGYAGRYCYERRADAVEACAAWDGLGHPMGPWVKYKGEGGECLGPGATP